MFLGKDIICKLIVPVIVLVCCAILGIMRFGILVLIFILPSDIAIILCFLGLFFLHNLRTKAKTGPKNISLYLAVLAALGLIVYMNIVLFRSGFYNRPGSALDSVAYFFMPFYTFGTMIIVYICGVVIETLIRATNKKFRQEDVNKLKAIGSHFSKYRLIYVLLIFGSIAYSIAFLFLGFAGEYLSSTELNPFSDIHYAAQVGKIKQVERFLNKGVDINTPEDDDNDTPLHVAAFHGQDRMVEYLVSKGALIEARNAIGQTPLHKAARGGSTSTIGLLIKLGAKVNVQSKGGNTPLRESARFGNFDNVKLFVNCGADINLPNNGNQTPLFQAVKYSYEDITMYLLEKGANVNLSDKWGRTLLGIAREKKYKNIEQILLEHGAKE